MGRGRDSPHHHLTAAGHDASDARTAVSVLFNAHATALHTYAAGRAGATVADDIISDTFVAAFHGWHTFDPARGNERAWLFGIATNLLRHHWRSQERHLAATARVPRDTQPANSMDRIHDRVDAAAAARLLIPALNQLTPQALDILLLNAWAGLEPTEIAHALGIPAPTVRTTLRRTRLQLRAAADLTRIPLATSTTGEPDAH